MVHVMVEDEKLDGLCMFGQMKANLSLCNEVNVTIGQFVQYLFL